MKKLITLLLLSFLIIISANVLTKKIVGYNLPGVMIPVLIMSLQAGIYEEIMTRGVLFRIVEDGLGTWWSVLISAMIFGFLHIWNPNATVFSSLSIAMTAGVVLALFYVLTRKLWVPIGIHIAWNFTLGGIYGAAVSGGDTQGLIQAEINGSELLTGGEFGPEASIITVIFFLIIGIFLAWKAIKKGAIIKPSWKNKS
jgi:membrane protease YdiL (CAAX protease family)